MQRAFGIIDVACSLVRVLQALFFGDRYLLFGSVFICCVYVTACFFIIWIHLSFFSFILLCLHFFFFLLLIYSPLYIFFYVYPPFRFTWFHFRLVSPFIPYSAPTENGVSGNSLRLLLRDRRQCSLKWLWHTAVCENENTSIGLGLRGYLY